MDIAHAPVREEHDAHHLDGSNLSQYQDCHHDNSACGSGRSTRSRLSGAGRCTRRSNRCGPSAAGERLPPQRDLRLPPRRQHRHGGQGLRPPGAARADPRRGRARHSACSTAPSRCRVAAGEAGEAGGLIDLTSNFPAPTPAQASLGDLLPTEEMAVELLADLLRYPDAAGALRHRPGRVRLAAPSRARRGSGTHSPHERRRRRARRAPCWRWRGPATPILAEQLTYSGLRSLAAPSRPASGAGPRTSKGIVPDALAAAARQRARGCSCSARRCTIRPPS